MIISSKPIYVYWRLINREVNRILRHLNSTEFTKCFSGRYTWRMYKRRIPSINQVARQISERRQKYGFPKWFYTCSDFLLHRARPLYIIPLIFRYSFCLCPPFASFSYKIVSDLWKYYMYHFAWKVFKYWIQLKIHIQCKKATISVIINYNSAATWIINSHALHFSVI